MRFFRTLTLASLSILLAVTFAFPQSLRALDKPFYSGNDIFFYDPDAVSCTTATRGPLVGNDNGEIIFKYFIDKGLTGEQAAGILGNMQQESGLNPKIIEDGAIAPDTYTPVHGTGFGLIQWTWTDRQQPLVNLGKSTSRKITDISLQLDYIWQELNQKYKHTLDGLKTATNPVDAAIIVHGPSKDSPPNHGIPAPGYEASDDPAAKVRSVRGGAATTFFEKYKSLAPTAISGSANCGTGTPSGDYLGDFTLYNQCDDKWGNRITPGGVPACQVGCGPTSAAMIITNMGGKNITPKETYDYVFSTNQWLPNNGGTSFDTVIDIAQKWGVNASMMQDHKDINAYKKIIDQGGLIMVAGSGAVPFVPAPQAHFVIIRSITSDGKFIVADPYPKTDDTNTKAWDPKPIIDGTFGAVVFTK